MAKVTTTITVTGQELEDFKSLLQIVVQGLKPRAWSRQTAQRLYANLTETEEDE